MNMEREPRIYQAMDDERWGISSAVPSKRHGRYGSYMREKEREREKDRERERERKEKETFLRSSKIVVSGDRIERCCAAEKR